LPKPTTESVRRYFAERGYELPEDFAYINNRQLIPYRHLKCGLRHQITWKNFSRGHGCPRCADKEVPSTEYIRRIYLTRGYEVPEDFVYTHKEVKIPYFCRTCKTNWATCWNDFREGHGCPTCAGCAKPTIEYLRLLFDRRGYDLLTDEYRNARSELVFWCRRCGQERRTTWLAFRQGQGCRVCGYARLSQYAKARRLRRDLQSIKNFLSSQQKK
jgi:hypothetical protein